MNDLRHCPDPDSFITLLYDDEGESAERAALEAHLLACPRCADLLASLDRTRGVLGAWHAPRPPLGFARVQPAEPPPLWRRVAPWAGMAAAAMITVAASAGLAGLEIRYDADGVTVRTGRASAQAAAPQPDPRTAWVERASAADPPWRADFDLLATQLRSDVVAQARASEARVTEALEALADRPVAVSAPGIDMDMLMRRVAEQIDQSEVRQQQNLALRVSELGREFQVRRQADLVQFQQGLERIEQQRRDLIRRVAVTQAPQP